jgi:hypothetical protein
MSSAQSWSALAQLEAERQALQLVARADVQLLLERLEAQWREQIPGRLPETYVQLRASLREVAFFVAVQVVDADPRRAQAIEISAPPHRWLETDVPGGRWGINNPDTLYFTVPVEAESAYVIHGQRHGAGPTDANFTLQVPDVFAAAESLGKSDLVVEPNGSYRVTLDHRPADGRPNHLQLRGDATQLVVRYTLADWPSESPDAIRVERSSGPEARLARREDELAQELTRRLATVLTHTINRLQQPIFRQPVNFIPQPAAAGDKSGFLPAQRNALGHFRLADDEALIATFNPAGAGYAGLTVTDVWGVSPDSRAHQNSLNAKQAALNADGTITVVIATADPGVENWIDPAGLREGIIMLRWQLLATLAHGPTVATKLVPIRELQEALPASISRISPEARRQQAAKRADSFDRRFTVRES